MTQPLPLRANLEWLKKIAKDRLAELRASNPEAKLNHAQLAVAREYGFASWRKLKSHVEQLRDTLQELIPASSIPRPDSSAVASEDPDLMQLLAAVDAGNLQTAADLLKKRPELVNAHGPNGQTPLHIAAQCNDARMALLLVASGADFNARYGQSGHTPLSWAVTCNALNVAETLVRLGDKPDFYCAAGLGLVDRVREYFDESGALRPDASRTGSSRIAPDGTRLPCPPTSAAEQVSDALYNASRTAQEAVVRFLLAKRPDLSFRAYMGATALHWAYFGGSPTVTELLEHAGADATARDATLQCTPRAFGICAPASWGFASLVQERLSQDPSLVNFMDGKTSPLHEAARGGSVEVVQLLLDAGADPQLLDGQNQTPLDVATQQGHAAIVELLRAAVVLMESL